ncbi:MAG: Gldg family protein [Planctomycetota bacterium]
MRDAWAVFKREFWAYFNSPIAYIFIIVFNLINCVLFMMPFFINRLAEMRSFFSLLPYTLAVFVPAISMRLWAEERRSSTMSLLLSLPVSSRSLVLGKYIASLAFYLIALISTVVVPIAVASVGNPDWGPIIGGYIGAVFLGAFFLSVGIFISGLSRDQIVAFVISAVLCFALYLLGTDYIAPFIDSWISGLGSAIRDNIGSSSHFASFGRGVIDLRDIIYFLAFITAFLILNAFTLESRIRLHSKKLFAVSVPVVLALAIAVSVLMGDIRLGRFDLTENRIYTVSASAKKIISNLKAPVRVRLYISPKDKMPSFMTNIERDISDKLSEYALISSNFSYEIIQPGSDIESLKDLEKKGIFPFAAMTIEQDVRETRKIYCALSISYLDKPEDIIGRVTPDTLGNLEYEIMSRIYRMTLPGKLRIAVLAPEKYPDPKLKDPNFRKMLAQMGRAVPDPIDNFKLIKRLLEENGYEVVKTQITKTEPIPEDIQTLMIVSPEELNQRQLYEIDRFLAEGKNLMIVAQTYQFLYGTSKGSITIEALDTKTGLNEILNKYGATISDEILMDSKFEILSVRLTEQRGNMYMTRVMPLELPVNITTIEENMNKEISITDRIQSLFYPCGSALKLNEELLKKNSLTCQTLVKSSVDSWTMAGKTGMLSVTDFDISGAGKAPNLPLSVIIAGRFPSAFEGKPRPEYPKEAEESPLNAAQEPPEKPLTRGEGKLILMGCADMFSDNFIGALGNKTFFLNLSDALAAGEELMSIRSKLETMRYFSAKDVTSPLFWRFITMALVPLVFVSLGVLRFALRVRRRKAYAKSFSTRNEESMKVAVQTGTIPDKGETKGENGAAK